MLKSIERYKEGIRQALREAQSQTDLEERIRQVSADLTVTQASLGSDYRFVTVERQNGSLIPEGPMMVTENPQLDAY